MNVRRTMSAALAGIEPLQWSGRVRELVGLLVASDGPAAGVGDFCEIHCSRGGSRRIVRAQVVGFRDGRVLLMPLEEIGGLQAGDTWWSRGRERRAWRSARSCWAACWTDSESPWTAGRPSARRPSTICMPRRPGRWSASTSPSRWSPACAPSTACCPSAKASASGFSADRAWARARCWARWRGTIRPTSA